MGLFLHLYSQNYGSPSESWITKKAEHLTAEELMLLNCVVGEDSRVPWTSRRSNQSILKEINPEYSLEGLMLKLKYFGRLMGIANSLGKTLILDRRRTESWILRWVDGITDSMDMRLSKLCEMVKDRKTWHAAVHGIVKSWTCLSD